MGLGSLKALGHPGPDCLGHFRQMGWGHMLVEHLKSQVVDHGERWQLGHKEAGASLS